ncbi:NADP-dependent oxidoreductase [Virgibacillus sp. YIM 98842]|uniref:NADP-dependent oxidoreductase n=1 Tax=Virgibacillus sp. YIM 98842 TaxID=2663533 RepID=UPI0013D949AF|nr:NADP-dependent oxidoreductase [Virgibacillus sp. YIM 98842]
MKAIVVNESGNIEDFKEIEADKPEVNADVILIEVRAVAINPVDSAIREGRMGFKLESPMILGTDISGVVAETGENVTDFSVGDEVFTSYKVNRGGGLAEYAAIPQKYVLKKPEKVSFEEIAALGIAALTAYQLVNKESYQVQEGETVFAQGGSGGVGTYTVQFAKQNGAHVIATTSRNEELLQSLGADEVVNYKKEDAAKVYANKADMLIDTVGRGTETLPVVVEGGRALTPAAPISEDKAVERNITVDRLVYQINTDQLNKFANQVERGDLKVVIDEVFPLTQEGVQQAYQLSVSGHAAGKIVLKAE